MQALDPKPHLTLINPQVKTAVCIGTGPSLKMGDIDRARRLGYDLFGCNNVYQLVPDLKVLYACNLEWWDEYWSDPKLRDHPCDKWTTNQEASEKYGLDWIQEKNGRGLCEDPLTIHHGHGSGYSLVSMAHKYGYRRILLLGYDLKYAPDYDGKAQKVGSTRRHFFGEYPKHLQHWPSVQVKNGVHVELVDLYKSIHEQGLVQLISCTPGSALNGVIPYKTI